MNQRTRSRCLLAGLLAACGIAVGLPLVPAAAPAAADPATRALADAAAYCVPPPPEAVVPAGAIPARRIAVEVPAQSRPFGEAAALEYAVTQGDVVELDVRTPRAGNVAIHGLTGLEPVDAGHPATVRFRAIYSGRFPLHFHGPDASHFEIVALNILPRGEAVAAAAGPTTR